MNKWLQKFKVPEFLTRFKNEYWLPRSYIAMLWFTYLLFIFSSYMFYVYGTVTHAPRYHTIAIVLAILNILIMIGYAALFFLYKWGFWLVMSGSIIEIIYSANVFHQDLKQSLLSSTSLLILIILLILGGKKSMWRALKYRF